MSDPRRLLQLLQDDIVHGTPESAIQACRRLEDAQAEGWLHLVESHRLEGPDDSLLHLAALFQQDDSAAELLRVLARLCPGLLGAQRRGQYQGQTALHIVVSKGNLPGAQALLGEMDDEKLLEIRATGAKFVGTVMEGQLALHTAALTLNWEMVDLLLRHGARLDASNSRGDTVLHALVRFAGQHPDRTDKVIEMLKHLHARTSKKTRLNKLYRNKSEGSLSGFRASDGVGDQLSVWFLENCDGLTPFKLAAVVGAGRVCAHILSLDGVYCLLDTHDGLFDTHLYDITELDPVTNRLWQSERHDSGFMWSQRAEQSHQEQDKENPMTGQVRQPFASRSKVEPLEVQGQKVSNNERNRKHSGQCLCCCAPSICCEKSATDSHSVLEIICGVSAGQAFCLLSTDVVRHLVKSKWHRFQGIYYVWFLVHLMFMVGLTSYAIYRPRVDNDDPNEFSTSDQASLISNSSFKNRNNYYSSTRAQRVLVKAWPWVSVAISVLYLGLECVRTFCLRQTWHLRRLHHNGLYRVMLVLLSLCLLADSLWYWLDKHNAHSNVFLILALLLGDWFLTFFLRAWRKFSFFTILFQKVLVGDMFRFSIMILLELVAFSAAMYVAYLPAGTHELPEEFEDVRTSILTMFRLMLGLSDVEVLSKAPAAWLAIGLYVVFVLLTYVLLLNSLIAMMSQTCALVSEDRDLQWHMQRLSVLLMLETLLPPRCRPLMGQRKLCRRYSLKTGLAHQEGRYLKPVTSVQASYTDGKAILRRQNLVRTMGFGELTLKLAPGQFNTYSSPTIGYNTKATMQKVGTLGYTQHYNTFKSKYDYSFSEEQENVYLGDTGLYNNVSSVERKPKDEPTNTSLKIVDTAELQKPKKDLTNDNDSYSPKPARRRHNSERKNRRTQTDTDGHLSRSYPDSLLRHHVVAPASGPPNVRKDNSSQQVVHYVAVPGLPMFPHADFQNVQLGYAARAGALHQPESNNHPAQEVYMNQAQHQQPTGNSFPHQQEQAQFNGHIAALRVPAHPSVLNPNQPPQQAGAIQPGRVHLVPQFSHQIPTQARSTGVGARVQFIDVNDLSTEA